MIIRSVFNRTGEEKIVSVSSDASLTQQHFKDEVDINNIMKRAESTGIIGDPSGIATRQAFYDDFSTGFDFQQCQNAIIAANDAFMSIPADIRHRFHNSPHEFVKFIQDPQNHREAVKLGLMTERPLSEPERVTKILQEMAEKGVIAVKGDANPVEPKTAVKTDVSGVPEGGKNRLK